MNEVLIYKVEYIGSDILRSEELIIKVANLCREFNAKEVILFGSRAKGIAVSGVINIDLLLEKIEEIPTLYSIDIVNMDDCKNELLLEDIKEYGREI